MMSTNAGPFASRVLLSENVALMLSVTGGWGVVFMLLILMSISRTELLAATFTVKDLVPVTTSPGFRLITEIVGAAMGLVGSNTVRMIRFAVAACPPTTTLWNLLAAIPDLVA